MAKISGGLNIGRAAVKVVLLDKSPFSGQQKQETALYYTPDVVQGLQERENVFPIPSPLNGVRLSEDLQGFDNFLTDGEQRLEDAFFNQEVEVADEDNEGETKVVTSRVDFDPAASARAKELGLVEEGTEETTSSRITAEQRDFFTWQVTENIFLNSDKNPYPPKFTEPPPLDNTPEWTYVALPRPGNDVNNLMLTPFMKKNPPDSASPVHWGCTMKESLAMNQPLEIIYFFCLRDPAIAKDAKKLTPRYKFVDRDGTEIDMRLTSSVYLAIEIGKGSIDNFLLILRNETEPFLFELRGKGKNREAVLLARFEGFNAAKLFDPNNKFFTISIEPVVGSFIIRSNVFNDTPWIIRAPLNDPIFIGQGPLVLYGGNVQAGFALRPIQYAETGVFKNPEITFSVVSRGEETMPICSTAAKGVGDVEQSRSYGRRGGSEPEMHLVDAEQVNGRNVTTILEHDAQTPTEGKSVQRKIDFETEETSEQQRTTTGGSSSDNQSVTVSTKSFQTSVTLTPGNMTQGNGFVIERGRSPYLFMLRCEMPATRGEDETEILDVTCDVMSVDLNWNATSYQEIRHSGSIKILNIRNVSGLDYRQFTNRSVYIKIYAGWTGGVGDEGLLPIFTGKTMKADVAARAEREIVTFQVEDYMAAMDGVKFILSPFYDGMKASLAVRDIVLQAGFPDDRIIANDTPIKSANLEKDFGLPFSNPFEQPTFRFKDGSSLKEGILKIARLDFKTIYFDSDGNFHYDDMPGGLFNNKNFKIKEEFWSSRDRATAMQSLKPNNQAWSMVTFSRPINDVYNVFQVLGVEKRLLARLTGATAYQAGIFDPNAEGYLGYRKHLLIQEPALGSFDALMRYLDNYRRRLTIPPLTAKFEIFGRNNLKPLDIITVDGQLFRVMNIQSRMDKAENTFYQNIEGEWMFAAGTGKDQQPELSIPNTGPSTAGSNPGSASTK